MDVTIWATINPTQIERIGSARDIGIIPENVSYTWNAAGPSVASFSLRRQGSINWPDLGPMTPIDIDIEGTRVWSGRLSEAPQQTGDTNVINVQCEGWQAHLEDDLVTKLYVHSSLADWVDMRGISAVASEGANNFGTWTTALGFTGAQPGGGPLTLSNPQGNSAAGFTAVSAFLQLQAGLSPRRIVVTWQSSTWANFAAGMIAVGGTLSMGLGANPLVIAGPTTTAGSPTGSFNQLELRVQNQVGTVTAGTDLAWFKVSQILVFGSTAWESGNASILKASDVIRDLQASCPLLSADLSQVANSTFNIPELYVNTPSTPGEIMRAVNAYHNWILQVDQYKRLVFQALPTVAVMSVGQWSNAKITDTSAGTSADVYNKAIVSGTAPDGTPVLQTRTAVSTLLANRGVTRTKAISLDMPTTVAAANQLGDTFLASHTKQPFKGSLIALGNKSFRSTTTGGSIPAFLVPTMAGQMLRLDHWLDPDTGGLGRDGRIAEATYTVIDDTVNVSLDNTRSNFEAFLARLQVLTTSALQT